MYCSIRDIKKANIIIEDKIGEVILDGRNYSIEEILDLSKIYERVVYDLSGIEEVTDANISEFKTLIEARENIVFMVSKLGLVKKFFAEEIPVFLSPENATVADSVERFVVLCKAGVTDVYVGGELGFKMPTVRKLADDFGVKVRIMPNMASISGFTNWFERKDTLTDFWVRPEDLEQYEPYVDIVEFAGENDKQSVLYDIYFLTRVWHGDLSQLVLGLEKLDNRGLVSVFTETRLNCGKKCLFNHCHSCQKFVFFSKLIVENNLALEVEESI